LRILSRRSPFSPDRTHIHHFLLDLGLSHRMVTLTCVSANIGFILLAYSLRDMGTTSLIGILVLTAFVFIGAIYFSRPKQKLAEQKTIRNTEIAKPRKILSLTPKTVEVE